MRRQGQTLPEIKVCVGVLNRSSAKGLTDWLTEFSEFSLGRSLTSHDVFIFKQYLK